MNNKRKDQIISISLYMDELKEVENLIDDISGKIVKGDDKYTQALNYLQRRKQSLQYEIQEHAKNSQEYYKEKLEEIKGLIERENRKVAKLEESEEIREINTETLVQEVINGEQGEKRDLLISKGVVEDLTKVAKYIGKEIEYFQSINVMDDEKQDKEDKAKDGFNSYEEEMEIIENITGNFDINNDGDMRNYLNQRKCGIYYSAQTAIDEILNEYTKKVEEIETLILSECEKQAELAKNKAIKKKSLETLIEEVRNGENSEMRELLVSEGVIKDLSKIREELKKRIKFLESIDIGKNGLPNIERRVHTDEEEQKFKMDSEMSEKNGDIGLEKSSDDKEMSQGDKFLVVAKPEGRFSFIKNAWKGIKEKLTRNSGKKEIIADTDKEIDEKIKGETFKKRLGGYNKSQDEFEKKAMAEVEKQSQLNSETRKKADQQYGK